MTRYELDIDGRLFVNETGEYVLFADHEAALAAKDAEIAGLRQKLTQVVKWLRTVPQNKFGIGANNPAFVGLAESYATSIEEGHLIRRL